MTNTKRRTRTRRALITLSALALTSILFTCAEVEPYCGTGEIYDPSCEFCFGSRAYPKCKNGKYNPLTAGCDKDTLVGTRCSNDSIVPLGTPCGGYTLIFASAPETGGRLEPLTPPDNGLTYDAKQTVLLQASANADYKFAGWAGAQPAERFKDEATVTAEYVTSGNMPKVTIVAMFKPVGKGKLITDVFPKSPALGGSVSRNKPEPEDGYKDGEQVVVTAHPADGFAFAGWSGADSSRNISVAVTMDESKTLVAMFTPVLYSLKVNTSPAGGGAVFIDGTPFGGGAYQDVGTKIITVWAKENQGYEFTGWSGVHARFDDETGVTTTVTLDADAEITANFKSGGGGGSSSSGGPALLCTLKVNINLRDGGSVLLDPPGGVCRLGGEVMATAAPNEGYSFTGWSGDTSSASNPVTVYMNKSKTLTANFKSNGAENPPPGTDTAGTGGGGQTAPDTAKVPFRVNVDATVTAERAGGGSSSSMPAPLFVRGGSVDTMRIQLQGGGGGGESWKIGATATAAGYVDTSYTINVAKGVNSLLNITLRQQATVPPPGAGESILEKVGNYEFEMMPVAAGTFMMGCTEEQVGDCYDDEKPAHEVTLTKNYYIGKYEVTQGLWKAVMGSNPSYFTGNDSLPVETVSWNQVQVFIDSLNNKVKRADGMRYGLPTEAQWEFAARGGKKSVGYKYSGTTDNLGDYAWYGGNYTSFGTEKVGTKLPNELGIYDMSGNVWEWVSDWYGSYQSTPQTDPKGPTIEGSNRVGRGGYWGNDARNCRVSIRYYDYPGFSNYDLGFRLVLLSP